MVQVSDNSRKRQNERRHEPTEATATSNAPVSTRTRNALAGEINRQRGSPTKRRRGAEISPRVVPSTPPSRPSGGKRRSSTRPKLPEHQKSRSKKPGQTPLSTKKIHGSIRSSKILSDCPVRTSSRKSVAGTKPKAIRRAEKKYLETGDANAFSDFLAPFAKDNKEMNLGDWEYVGDKKRWCRVDKSTGFIFWAPTEESFL